MTSPLFQSPWPAEDGGAARLSAPLSGSGLSIQRNENLSAVVRKIHMGTMTVLGAPGEVFLLTHTMLRSKLGLPTTCCVERIDAQSLKTICKSPRLPGGPAWPGGIAVHRNGDLYVVYGRYVHRLNRSCELIVTFKLPINRPYNSFVLLENGLLITKDLSDSGNSTLSVIDSEKMQAACTPIACPEPSIARLSAVGNTVYVVGVKSVFRYHWNAELSTLQFDPSWRFDYVGDTTQTYGWDAVIDGSNVWFMDNGKHSYMVKMIGNGVNPTPNNLIRVAIADSNDAQIIPISGINGGSITNPPLIDLKRNIVVAYDSANRTIQAWAFNPESHALTKLWNKQEFGCASHMILYPDSGELVTNDYQKNGEEVVVLNIDTGTEIARTRIGGISQGVVFPSVGWGRDFYWTTFDRLARVFVA
ncbi:MAG: hypothetical protein KA484_00250 [Rhodocyclaceae bacterium]|nr:hypothetical protein [Rhodocyclaceae bacterium]